MGAMLDCLESAGAHYPTWLDNNEITAEAAWTRAYELAAAVFTLARKRACNSGVAITGYGVKSLFTRLWLPSGPLVAAAPEEWAKVNLCQSDVTNLLDHAATFGGAEGA